jgi:hypothetical protein
LIRAGGLALAVLFAAGGVPAEARTQRVTPVESISGFVARFQAAHAALQAGDCARVAAFNRSSGYRIPCDESARRLRGNFRVLRRAQFGTGALVDLVDNEAPGGAVAVLAVGADRRFRLVFELINPAARAGRLETATRATPAVLAAHTRTAGLFLTAERRRDCGLYFHVAYTAELTKAQACRAEFHPPSERQREIAADPAARPARIGGTYTFQFFRLWTRPGHYRTLVVARIGTGRDLYLADTQRVH